MGQARALNARKTKPGQGPITALAANGPPIPGLLSDVAKLQRDSVPTNLNQTNIQPVYDIYANAQGRDLGGISTLPEER